MGYKRGLSGGSSLGDQRSVPTQNSEVLLFNFHFGIWTEHGAPDGVQSGVQ